MKKCILKANIVLLSFLLTFCNLSRKMNCNSNNNNNNNLENKTDLPYLQ